MRAQTQQDVRAGRWSLQGQEGPWRQDKTQNQVYHKGNSLVIQGLRLYASNVRDGGSIPGWGTKISHVGWHGPENTTKKKKKPEWPRVFLLVSPSLAPSAHGLHSIHAICLLTEEPSLAIQPIILNCADNQPNHLGWVQCLPRTRCLDMLKVKCSSEKFSPLSGHGHGDYRGL